MTSSLINLIRCETEIHICRAFWSIDLELLALALIVLKKLSLMIFLFIFSHCGRPTPSRLTMLALRATTIRRHMVGLSMTYMRILMLFMIFEGFHSSYISILGVLWMILTYERGILNERRLVFLITCEADVS